MKKLQAELDEEMQDPHAIPDISVINRLPYLNAFVKEGTISIERGADDPHVPCRSPTIQCCT